uniref:SAM_MT_RSMB_NOP domain-containing protein n=1 Tax=Parastrongyloides trichosuri TaxID=131310 RepID=A0A0N4ZP41_PARTI
MVMLYELCDGKGYKMIPKKYRSELDNIQTAIKITLKDLENEGKGISFYKNELKKIPEIPRYVRVNTLKISKEDVIEKMLKEGYQISNDLNNAKEFCVDVDIDDLLIFSPKARIYDHYLIKSKKLILQDKASCLSSFLLSPPPGSKVIDTCAAPGMKTSHLCALMNNTGQVYAFDRDKRRFNDLKDNLLSSGAENASVFNIDFLKVPVEKLPYDEVEYALVDPPCSGSGMIKRMDSHIDDEEIDKNRLHGLGNLQAMILKHAMGLPKLKKIVYSTCSIHEIENECVIEEIMKDENIKNTFRLVNALPSWKERGLNKYDFGSKCLRCNPTTSKTNGFFVAVFERI